MLTIKEIKKMLKREVPKPKSALGPELSPQAQAGLRKILRQADDFLLRSFANASGRTFPY